MLVCQDTTGFKVKRHSILTTTASSGSFKWTRNKGEYLMTLEHTFGITIDCRRNK